MWPRATRPGSRPAGPAGGKNRNRTRTTQGGAQRRPLPRGRNGQNQDEPESEQKGKAKRAEKPQEARSQGRSEAPLPIRSQNRTYNNRRPRPHSRPGPLTWDFVCGADDCPLELLTTTSTQCTVPSGARHGSAGGEATARAARSHRRPQECLPVVPSTAWATVDAAMSHASISYTSSPGLPGRACRATPPGPRCSPSRGAPAPAVGVGRGQEEHDDRDQRQHSGEPTGHLRDRRERQPQVKCHHDRAGDQDDR